MKLKTAPKAVGRPKALGAATTADNNMVRDVGKARVAKALPAQGLSNSVCKSLLPGLFDPPLTADTRTVLYLFAGPSRENDLAHHLRAKGLQSGVVIRVVEVDVCRDVKHDLLREDLRLVILSSIEGCLIDFLVLSPPCASWSRSLFNRMVKGPLPLPSRTHPWGFPWLTGVRKAKLMRANSLTKFAIKVMTAACEAGIGVMLEHPEDLGRYYTGACPASIWQLPELKALTSRFKATRKSFHQHPYGAASPKPSGLWTTMATHADFGVEGWPQFDDNGCYTGPLARIAARAMPMGPDTTAASAKYPDKLCLKLATMIVEHLVSPRDAPTSGGRGLAYRAIAEVAWGLVVSEVLAWKNHERSKCRQHAWSKHERSMEPLLALARR